MRDPAKKTPVQAINGKIYRRTGQSSPTFHFGTLSELLEITDNEPTSGRCVPFNCDTALGFCLALIAFSMAGLNVT